MPTILAPNNLIRVTAVTASGGQEGLTTFHYIVSAVGAPPATDEDVGDAFDAIWSPTYLQMVTANVNYDGVLVQKLLPLPLTVAATFTGGAGAGLATGNNLPKQVRGLISWRTTLAGRGERGRNYIPFPGDVFNQIGGHPTGAYQTLLNTLATNILGLTAVAVGGRTCTIGLVLFHKKTSSFTPISAFNTRLMWATQRKSGDYGRPNIPPI